jgi:putative membrane protein
MSNVQNAQGDSATDLAQQRAALAIKRSAIAAERTLLAWIRTAMAMIGFGFTIYKFFQYLQSDIGRVDVLHPNAPRNLGLSLIALGTLS